MRTSTYSEDKKVFFRKLLWSRFPEFSFETVGRHIWVVFDQESSASTVATWTGTYGDVSFVFREFYDKKNQPVSLRCVALYQNWLAHDNISLTRDADIHSRIPYEEELFG